MRPLFSDSPSISCKQPSWKHYLFREQTLHRATEQMGPARSSHYPPADFWFILEASAFLSSLSLENLWSPDSSFPRMAEGEGVPLFNLETTPPNELKGAVRKWMGHSLYLKMTTNIFCKQMLMPIHTVLLFPNCRTTHDLGFIISSHLVS